VRAAKPGDVPEFERVISQHWKMNLDYLEELKNPEAVLLVAEGRPTPPNARQRVLGAALMWVKTWNKTGYLVELAVDKSHQRKGIATKLVQSLAGRARKAGLRAIIVETQPSVREGMDFYLHNGFRLCGYNDRYYTNNPTTSKEIALFFSLDL
jgi:ribosomal protein S18 acetylase RimI-like enzyme